MWNQWELYGFISFGNGWGGTRNPTHSYKSGGDVTSSSPFQWKSIHNTTFLPTPVCVWLPFVWLVSNGSTNASELHCNQTTCFYVLCWNATAFPLAVVTRLPHYVPVPMEAPSSLTLFREKRDFGITTAVVAAITVAAVSATVSAVA